MSWLRLDDGFTRNPKFVGWTVRQKWSWLEVLEYCARYETGGKIPADLNLLPRSTTPALLELAETSGLIDRDENGARIVHDWDHYNPTNEGINEAVSRYLTEHPDASANEVCREVKGTRKRVLASVNRFRAGTESGSTEPVPNRYESGSESGYAPARAHGPRPDPLKTSPDPGPGSTTTRAAAANRAGPGPGHDLEQINPQTELDRIAAAAATDPEVQT
jgi:hypothetical protein